MRKRTTKGNRWLRRALTEAAWAASHTKGSYHDVTLTPKDTAA
jgi:hypothetical protein